MSKASISFPLLGDFSINPSRYFEIGDFKLYWYGVILAFGFVMAMVYCIKKAPKYGLTTDNLADMVLIAIPSAIVGCRLYYVIFNWSQYKDNLIEILYIWKGGLGMYGGIILAAIALYIYARKKRISAGAMFDLAAFGLLIGQCIGRWGNFINREAYGYETTVPWRMGLTLNGNTIYVHPAFLYESLWNLLGFILLHNYSKKHRKFDGQIFVMYIGWYGVGRMVLESIRTDSLMLFSTGIQVSQLVGFLSLVAAIIILVLAKKRGKCDPENLFVNRIAVRSAAEATEEAEVSDETEAEFEAYDTKEEEPAEEIPCEPEKDGFIDDDFEEFIIDEE